MMPIASGVQQPKTNDSSNTNNGSNSDSNSDSNSSSTTTNNHNNKTNTRDSFFVDAHASDAKHNITHEANDNTEYG